MIIIIISEGYATHLKPAGGSVKICCQRRRRVLASSAPLDVDITSPKQDNGCEKS